MAKAKALKRKPSQATETEGYSSREAKDRFERAVDIAVATKPMHSKKKKNSARR